MQRVVHQMGVEVAAVTTPLSAEAKGALTALGGALSFTAAPVAYDSGSADKASSSSPFTRL